MNQRPISKPLVRRIAMVLSFVVITAVVGMIGTLFVADSTSGHAAAINTAGSLRMQAYKIANSLHMDLSQSAVTILAGEFDQRLMAPELQAATRKREPDLVRAYDIVISEWQDQYKPLLLTGEVSIFLGSVDDFVGKIDDMVRLLEINTEAQIRTLRTMQVIGMLVTLLLIFLAISTLQRGLSNPLSKMLRAAEEIRHNRFDVRVDHDIDDELGLLASTFNDMAKELDRFYTDLESRVEEKTHELHQSNQSIQFLYESARRFTQQPGDVTTHLRESLVKLKRITGIRAVQLCLVDNKSHSSTGSESDDQQPRPHQCGLDRCNICEYVRFGDPLEAGSQDLIRFNIETTGVHFGYIMVTPDADKTLPEWQQQLFEASADIIATNLGLAERSEQASRLLLMEERAAIARELHDSLAQSLSYQKIQVARARKLHERGADRDIIFESLDDLQSGLNNAYRQLRELLSTFRLKLDVGNLESGLQNIVDEFCRRGNVNIELDYDLRGVRLSPNEEVHVLQIIREALSNVVQHSKAESALLKLRHAADGNIGVSIIDDGIGVSEQPVKADHFGLVILRDRAYQLNGDLKVGTNDLGGTTVHLQFAPQHSPWEDTG